MPKLSRDQAAPLGGLATLHARETLIASGNLGAVSSEIFLPADGAGTVAIDLRGAFNATLEISGTLDGVNWTLIPMRPLNSSSAAYVAVIAGTVTGTWIGTCSGFRAVRARCTAFTSGPVAVTLTTDLGLPDSSLSGQVTTGCVTSVSAAGAALTLTLGAPGAGLRHYITAFEIERYAAAALVASATPVTVTTTNLATALAFTLPADALAQGAMGPLLRREFGYPLMASAVNTATTFIMPLTTNLIWRATVYFYVAP